MSVVESAAEPILERPVFPPAEGSVVLHGVPWEIYEALRSEEDNNHVRMTYDRGALELMSPSRKHAKVSSLIGWMICEWTLLRQIKIELGGDTTFKKQDLERGLEPDNCFWVAKEAAVRDKDEIDLSQDPPPDLALEVEFSRTAIPKLPIYQELKVPEVWRWHKRELKVLTLGQSGEHIEQSASTALPGFPVKLVEQLLRERNLEGDTALMIRFREAISTPPNS
jgi:Uma2 family endonuclease